MSRASRRAFPCLFGLAIAFFAGPDRAGADATSSDLETVDVRLTFLGDRADPAIAHARRARSRSLAYAAEGRAREARAEATIALAATELAEARARLGRDLAAYRAQGRDPRTVPRARPSSDDARAAFRDGASGDFVEAARVTASRLLAHARLTTRRALELENALPAPTARDVGEPSRRLAAVMALETVRETFAEASADEPRRYGSLERKREALRERARRELLASMPRRLATLATHGVERSEIARYEARVHALAEEADHASALVDLEDLADDLDARARHAVAP